MLNIKDKELRYMLWMAGVLEADENRMNSSSIGIVQKTHNALEKIEALCDHLGVKLVCKDEHPMFTSRWKVVEKPPETLSSQNGMTKQTTTKQHNAYRKRRK
jgi:hypothetical protein